jgi:hypothetical protein
MSNRKYVICMVALLIAAGWLLSACGGSAPQTPPKKDDVKNTTQPKKDDGAAAQLKEKANNSSKQERLAPPHKFNGNPPNGPEKNDKAVGIEVKAVAQSLNLSPEMAAKLEEAYKASRQSFLEARRDAHKPGERVDFGKMREIAKAEREKFGDNVKGFLTSEQATKVVSVLGASARLMDPLAVTLDEMNLDDSTKAAAWKLVFDYVEATDGVMQAAQAANDFQALRDKGLAIKEKLDTDMASLLPPDKAAKWKETSARFGGQRPIRGGEHGPGQPPIPAPRPAVPQPDAAQSPKPAGQ